MESHDHWRSPSPTSRFRWPLGTTAGRRPWPTGCCDVAFLGTFVAAGLLSSGCGAAAAVREPLSLRHADVAGYVTFEARLPTPRGASQVRETRPARSVTVEALGADGQLVGRGRADEEGRFRVPVVGEARTVRVTARVEGEGRHIWVARDPIGVEVYGHEVAIPPSGEVAIALTDGDDAGTGGAFHILDTVLAGIDAVRAWTGRNMPPLFVYWARGTTTEWSFYRGERPVGSGRFAIELMAGRDRRDTRSDMDEHDEAIILHELGHFVMDRLTTDSSAGGNHPAGFLLDPGLAWEEGRASWFAASVRRDPAYRDTIGIEPFGRLRVDHDLERGMPGPRGLGSEQGVAEILWDLADGGDDLPDADGDPVHLGAAAVLDAMIAMSRVEGAFPVISSLLGWLVETGQVTIPAVKDLLARGAHPAALLPSAGATTWPVDLPVPGVVGAKIDGLSDPAPSGGPNRPENGQDAMRAYRLRMTERSRLSLRLRIFGSGRGADREDLDLELRDIRARLLDSSRGETPIESLSRVVEPGYYVVYIRDGGQGNRVGYELSATATALSVVDGDSVARRSP